MAESLDWWYQYHKEDYKSVRERLTMCRNIMLHGRKEAAVDMLRKSCVNAVLSIQTTRERHERAFTAYQAGDTSLETACSMTVYGNQKADWLHESLATVDFGHVIEGLRHENGGPMEALDELVENFTGLSHTKGGFALAMCGIWELACPDTRVVEREYCDINSRIRTKADYYDALDRIDDALDADIPLFIKQWVIYDYIAEEHATHDPFYVEVLPHYKV